MKATEMIRDWEHLPLGLYERISAIVERDPDGDDPDADPDIMALLCGLDPGALLDLPIDEFRRIRDAASFLTERPSLPPVRKSYEIGGLRCSPVSDVNKMTAGQFMDFKDISSRGGEHPAALISCLLIPDGCTYGNGYDVFDFQERLRAGLMSDQAFALVDFFAAGLTKSWSASLSSFEGPLRRIKKPSREAKEMIRKLRRHMAVLRASGAGSAAFTALLNLPERLSRRCAISLCSNFSTLSATPTTGRPSAPGSSASSSGAREGAGNE